jgi:hypothetical protein
LTVELGFGDGLRLGVLVEEKFNLCFDCGVFKRCGWFDLEEEEEGVGAIVFAFRIFKTLFLKDMDFWVVFCRG